MQLFCALNSALKTIFQTLVGGRIKLSSPHIYICISLVQSHSCVRLFVTPWIAACQASLSIPTPGVHPNPCPLSWWCHPAISSSVVVSSCSQTFPASGSFQMSQLWLKYWSFSFNISLSNEHPGLISFRIDWLDLLAIQGTIIKTNKMS